MNGIIKGSEKVGTVTQDAFGNLSKHTQVGAYVLFDHTGSVEFVPNFTKVENVTDILNSRHNVKLRECEINGRRCFAYNRDIVTVTGENDEKETV